MKSMKKFIALSCATAICIGLCACGKSDNISASDSASVSTESVSEASEQVGMPNPMVEVNGVDDFEASTGIKLNGTYLPSDSKFFIISEYLDEVQWTEENVDGDEVQVTLRAAKKSDEDISGVNDSNMTTSEEEYSGVKVTHRYSESTKTDIYDFQNDENMFCFMIQGEVSQMMFGELFDSALLACGFEIN